MAGKSEIAMQINGMLIKFSSHNSINRSHEAKWLHRKSFNLSECIFQPVFSYQQSHTHIYRNGIWESPTEKLINLSIYQIVLSHRKTRISKNHNVDLMLFIALFITLHYIALSPACENSIH